MIVNYFHTKNPSVIRKAKPLVEDDDEYDYGDLLNSFICEKFDVVDRFHLEEEVSTYLYASDHFYEIYLKLFGKDFKVNEKSFCDFEFIKSQMKKSIIPHVMYVYAYAMYQEMLAINDTYLCIVPIKWDDVNKIWHFLVIK